MRLAHSTSAPKCESNFTAHLNWANSMPLQHATYLLIPTQVGDRTVAAHVVAEAHYTKKGVRELRLEIVSSTVSTHDPARYVLRPGDVTQRDAAHVIQFRPFVNRGRRAQRLPRLPLGACFELIPKSPPGPPLECKNLNPGRADTKPKFVNSRPPSLISPLVHSESRLQVTIMIL